MRRFFILPVMGLIWLGLIGLQQAIVNWHPAISGEPGALLYAATFDDFNDEWQQYSGVREARISDGVLRIESDNEQERFYSVAQPYFGDFDLHMTARPVGGPLNNGYGVVFRLQNPENVYWFLISSDGYYSLSRKVGGVEKKLSDWISTPHIHQGIDVTNRVRVVAVGERFQFYINDQQVQLCVPDNPDAISTYYQGECREGKMVDTLVDGSLATGQLGAVILTLDEPDVSVEFDNFLVFAPRTEGADS